jgi:ankyrin repeat protein
MHAIHEWNTSLAKAADKAGNTPLHYAALIGNSCAVRELLSKDTEPVYKHNLSVSFPVHIAAEAGNFMVIKELLNSCPDVGELLDKENRNFIHIAVKHRRTRVIMLACRVGINANVMNAKDKNGNTPLHLAVKSSDAEIFALLSKNKTVNPNIRNEDGLTPLDISTSLQDHLFTYSLVCILMISSANMLPTIAQMKYCPHSDRVA